MEDAYLRYRDASLPPRERALDLLSSKTVEEKTVQMR